MDNENPQPSDAPPSDDPPADSKPASLEDQLAQAKEDAEKLRNNWHRAEADFQNYKRRSEQDREELRRFGNVSVIINILPVLDDFERAFSSLDSRLAGLTWLDGMRLIYR